MLLLALPSHIEQRYVVEMRYEGNLTKAHVACLMWGGGVDRLQAREGAYE